MLDMTLKEEVYSPSLWWMDTRLALVLVALGIVAMASC